MNYGFFRVASVSPSLSVADCNFNSKQIIELVKKAQDKKIKLLVFPELSICAYLRRFIHTKNTSRRVLYRPKKYLRGNKKLQYSFLRRSSC